MSRSYRSIFLAIVGCLTLLSAAAAQNVANVASNSNEIHRSADRRTQNEQGNSAQAVGAGRTVENGEQAEQAECGTAKECRAEQREKDDLVAQQRAATAAEAAAKAGQDQLYAAWWQAGIGAAGVILLILTASILMGNARSD